jgi:pantothenate kinase
MNKKKMKKKTPSLTEKSETYLTVSFHEIRAPLDKQGIASRKGSVYTPPTPFGTGDI